MKSIETKRFILKMVEEKYIEDMYRILSNPKVIRNLIMSKHESIKDTEKLLKDYYDGYKNGVKYPYEILDKNTNKFLGVF